MICSYTLRGTFLVVNIAKPLSNDWSYIRSEFNAVDLDIYQNKFFVIYKSVLVVYDYDGSENFRMDLKKDLDINRLKGLEIDSHGNIWLFSYNGDIQRRYC